MKDKFLKQAILKNYKTIKEIDVEFNSDLNIIIGKNGVGKSNFIEYLSQATDYFPNINSVDATVLYSINGDSFKKVVSIKDIIPEILDTVKIEELKISNIIDIKLFKNDELLNDKEENIVLDYNLPYSRTIRHGIPQKYEIVDRPVNATISLRKERPGIAIFPEINSDNVFKYHIALSYLQSKQILSDKINLQTLKNPFVELNDSLSRFSNIEEIRIGTNTMITEKDGDYSFNNLYLEFYVNKKWLPFNSLSDGTKRIFYIISEIVYSNREIILLEEPELGLHPSHLNRLMDFIKENKDRKQFIITTHSPLVLNILDKNQLDSIIIANLDIEFGTKLKHLSEQERSKALEYMDEMDLSDYWLYSDLVS